MGQNLPSLTTKVTTAQVDTKYGLWGWEREQVVVLLSRTRYAKDIIFVGSKRDTVDALASVLQLRYQFSEYISHLLTQLAQGDEPFESASGIDSRTSGLLRRRPPSIHKQFLSNGTLAIVPMTLLSQWQNEIKRFAPKVRWCSLSPPAT